MNNRLLWPWLAANVLALVCATTAFAAPAVGSRIPAFRAADDTVCEVQISTASTSVNENAGTVSLKVARTGGTFGSASVHYEAQAGTAIAGADYTAATGELRWADGNSDDKTLTIPLLGNALVEGNKTFTVRLSNPIGCTLGPTSSATVTIADNDHDYSGRLGIIGYLPYYRMNGMTNSIGLYCTDIIFAFIWPESDGSLDTSCLDSARISKLRELKNAGARILVSVGGAGLSSHFDSVTADAPARAAFIQKLLNMCRSLDLDGIDFDWEFPSNAAEEHNYAALLNETKQAFQSDGFLVTVALNADLQIDYAAMKAAHYAMVDRVHLMSYARANSLGYHSTYARSIHDVEQLLVTAGVPNQKLYLGVPFYGRCTYSQDLYRTYAQIASECHPSSDNIDLATYPGIGDIYFNGVDTIKQKTRYAIDKQLGGIMIWELGQDTSDMTLLNAINDTMTHNPQAPIPDIKANDLDFTRTLPTGTPICITVNMDAGNYAGTAVDWWVVTLAGSSWYYLNPAFQWMPFDGNPSRCHPLHQGALFNLPVATVLDIPGLLPGLYTFWLAVEYPMDGMMNSGGLMLVDSVSVGVQ